MECKLKQKCPNKSSPLYNCWDTDCTGWMHEKCSSLLLDKHQIPSDDRPQVEDRTDSNEPVVFCKKGCFLKWSAAKKREAKAAAALAKAANAPKKRKVPWEEDGSLDVLMEWITTEGNYADYCGANGNKGKSKTAYHKELSLLLKEKIPECERNEKDVENKITSLENVSMSQVYYNLVTHFDI